MNERLLVIVPVFNRWNIARHCLENLVSTLAPNDELVIFDDCSDELDPRILAPFASKVFRTQQRIGIDAQRRLHFDYAWKRMREDESFSHLYLTDSDALHDPRARREMLAIQEQVKGRPLCGYNTTAHSSLEGNTLRDHPSEPVIWRRYAPGISYLLTADHVSVIAPRAQTLAHWDWDTPTMLGNLFATTRVSFVEHVGIGGLHHPTDGGIEGGDRATNPTEFLVRKRAEVIAQLR